MNKPTSQSPGPVTTPRSPTTPAVVARVMGAVAKQHGGQVPAGHYVGRMQTTVNRGPLGGGSGRGRR